VSLAENIPVDIRDEGRTIEIQFWRDFCKSERFIDNFCKATPNPEMDVDVELFIKGIVATLNSSGATPRILDIGSGPVSMLSRSFVGQSVALLAADPLADDYRKMWVNSFGNELTLPVACDGEKLSSAFGGSQFDIVHIRNALDHVIHPISVLEEMIKVAKRGGFIIVHGFENEADAEGWDGFHQWNLSTEMNDLIVRGKNNARYSVANHFKKELRVLRSYRRDIHGFGKGWCGFVAQVI
jgi:SAM-dependent methyltransferase